MIKGGPTDFEYITARDLHALHGDDADRSLEELQALAKVEETPCAACGNLPAWRYGGLDMCFPCTTGESDASGDYELIREE